MSKSLVRRVTKLEPRRRRNREATKEDMALMPWREFMDFVAETIAKHCPFHVDSDLASRLGLSNPVQAAEVWGLDDDARSKLLRAMAGDERSHA